MENDQVEMMTITLDLTPHMQAQMIDALIEASRKAKSEGRLGDSETFGTFAFEIYRRQGDSKDRVPAPEFIAMGCLHSKHLQ